jgi:uncharacterized phosphosugar-binding protein
MLPASDYLAKCRAIIDTVERQIPQIEAAADLFAQTILAGRMVHVFGSGHSRIMVEEMWPRYGSFPGFNPIVELSLSFHNLVVGANGQRQAMFLENVSGFADRILRNFDLSAQDTALVISSSGCNVVPIEIAEIVLDTGAPVGDAMVHVPGLETPVSPGSTVGGCLLVNSIKGEVAARLTAAGQPPKVLTAAAICGTDRATELFEAAYDEHGRRLSRLYEKLGA